MDRIKLIAECHRLNNHLEHNQLVQANAITSKMEAIITDTFKAECTLEKKVEDHAYWKAYKSLILIKNFIMSGRTQEALSQTRLTIDQL